MAHDDYKLVGPLKESLPDAGGAPVRSVPVLGVVKDNVDPNRSGRIFVYIGDNTGQDPDDRSNWTPCSYLSPFFGKTLPTGGEDTYGSYKENPSSYGMWFSPPDIGTTVVCLFLNGDMNYGFYIGSIPDPDSLHMIPAIGSSEEVTLNPKEANTYGGATRLPVTNINPNNPGIADTGGFITAAKPVHSYVAGIMSQQGIIRDPIRGPISTSAQRETPSRVGWGVSTPGRPIYEGGFDDQTIAQAATDNTKTGLKVIARRGGHSIVMDDGDLIGRDQLIRIRTALGHQIMMSDDGQTLSILHSNGQSYVELGKEGTVDIYSTNSFNVRTQGDLNLHADNNININAMKNINIRGESIKINTDKDFTQRVGENYKFYVLGKYLVKSDSAISLQGDGDVSLSTKATAYINGKNRVNLNTGNTSHIPEKVELLPLLAQTDTLFDQEKGFAAAPGKLLTIVSRAPAHMPWANSNQGVETKVNLNSDANLPTPPAPALATANETAQAAPVTQSQVTQSATMPVTPQVSQSIDKNTTSAVLGQMAKDAATGPAAEAVKKGVGTITQNGVPTAVVGAFAQTPSQLERAGIIKPGSSTLINSLVASGMPVNRAMSSNMFTGRPGAENLPGLVTNVAGQALGVVRNLQQSQRQLQQFGLLTGREPATQSVGAVMSGVVNGVSKTMNVIRNVQTVSNIASGLATGGSGGAVMAAMAAGSFAASLAQNKTGGLGGISQALNAASRVTTAAGLQQAVRGVTGAAFDAIVKKFVPLKSGVPQNLLSIAKQSVTTNLASAAIQSAITNPKGSGSLLDVASKVALGSVGSFTGALASGLGNLPGGQRVAAAVVNNAIGSINNVPGLGSINLLAAGRSTAALNGIPQASLPNPLAPVSNLVNSVIPGAGGVINSLVGGGAVNPLNQTLRSVSNLTGSLGGLTNSLSALASAGLPAGAAAQLTGAISALSGGGAQPVRLPTIGLNTTNRSQINSSTVALLGDNSIPKPNFTGTIEESTSTLYDKAIEKTKQDEQRRKELSARFDAQFKVTKAAKDELDNAKKTLPEGDPQIDELLLKYGDEYKKLLDIRKEILG